MSAEESAEAREEWRRYLAGLKQVAVRRNASAEPFGMIREDVEAMFCLDAPERLSSDDRAACAEPARAAKIAEIRAMREE